MRLQASKPLRSEGASAAAACMGGRRDEKQKTKKKREKKQINWVIFCISTPGWLTRPDAARESRFPDNHRSLRPLRDNQ